MKFYRYYTLVVHHPYRHVEVGLDEYKLVKETPKGYWITDDWDYNAQFTKWVSKTARKRYAYPNKEAALIGYIKRTERYTRILKARLRDAGDGLSIARHKEGEMEHEKS